MLGLIHPRINSYDRPKSGNLASFDLFASLLRPGIAQSPQHQKISASVTAPKSALPYSEKQRRTELFRKGKPLLRCDEYIHVTCEPSKSSSEARPWRPGACFLLQASPFRDASMHVALRYPYTGAFRIANGHEKMIPYRCLRRDAAIPRHPISLLPTPAKALKPFGENLRPVCGAASPPNAKPSGPESAPGRWPRPSTARRPSQRAIPCRSPPLSAWSQPWPGPPQGEPERPMRQERREYHDGAREHAEQRAVRRQ